MSIMRTITLKSTVIRSGAGHDLLREVCRDATRVNAFSIHERFDGSNWYSDYEIVFKEGKNE